ncbi:MAG: tryptophan--tRNA ligase [Bacteriovoracia bacterium]
MSKATQKRILSGIQPSGTLMLGNYLGALKSWVQLQSQYECFYCLVDLHAITIKQDPEALRTKTYEGLATYLACGIDPKSIFVQSHIPQHSELSWILGCFTYMGELSRMTQFKDKSAKQKNIPSGLFTYPILMAADILLYQANLVPVGQDQKQHLELSRDIAIRLNNLYGKLFEVPEVFNPPVGAKIMSLADPTKKMSKSDEDPNATIFLTDSDEVILKKLKKAVTDSGSEISYSEEKPGIRNLIQIQSAILGEGPEKVVERYVGKQYGHLKIETAEVICQALRPLRQEIQKRLADKDELDKVLRQGAEKAGAVAEITLAKVQQAIGFLLTKHARDILGKN